ncbi:Rpn family recombination-promoting nuclease/putative transposase [Treponema sp.]|uniref:Rpn family recombination-promoting nuclease/putative transposase n=2 Tax=Treponema sp. TaxID=166 RepID=UPI003FA201FC
MEDELQITLTNDYAFKRLLGSEENKPLLQDFLECILDLTPQQVLDLEFMDKELTKEEFSDKTGILDVKLKLTDGTMIDIEIQASWNASFVKRTLFYWAKMYTADFKAGESYDKLHRCIAINIIADGFRLNDAIHSEYLLQEKAAHTILTDVLEIHFLDLPAAKRAKEEGKTAGKQGQLINWLRFIGATNKEERAMIATKSPVLQMLNEKIDVLTLSPTERKLYESRMKLKSDITTISETQFSAGVERGLAEGKSLGLAEGKLLGLAEGEARGKSLGLVEGKSLGLAEGSRQKAFETARMLKQFGDSVQKIVQVTGLTVQEVEMLK